MDQLVQNYDSNFVSIRYHIWWPFSNDPFWLYNQGEIEIRKIYYNISSVPRCFFDGSIDGGGAYGNWETIVQDRILVDSPLDIRSFAAFDSVSLTGDLNIYVIATSNISQSDLKLRIAITENNLDYGGSTYNQVFRDMIPSTEGIPFIITEGDTVEFFEQYSCPAPLIYQNCEIVVFVQSDVDREILQCNRIKIPEDLVACNYVVGDINGSDSYNGLDVTYGVAYLKGGSPPPFSCECPPHGAWYVAGDVNASCNYNGLDITYGVNYLKGVIPILLPCPDCPPSGE
ncbi:MAG: Omp28-related outer membrane protein [Candidatus Zixiibacteriota bacterium]|nr:MAG: Omp28-related outer membrane protein [candidate division Zixibacteria bacterium]